MGHYRKKRNGSEYYERTFNVLPNGRQVYAKTNRGVEIYPKHSCDDDLFAKNEEGEFYYATDSEGNEYYPVRNRRSRVIRNPENADWRPALYRDGTQRYPTDHLGNEYYLQRGGMPFLMTDARGEPYLAKSRKGHTLIPWNFLREYMTNDPYQCSKDADNNLVYINEVDVSVFCKILLRCICSVIVLCPNVLTCASKML